MLYGLGSNDVTGEMYSRDLSDNTKSKPLLIADALGFSLSIGVSGNPIGVFKLQSSNFTKTTNEPLPIQADVPESSWADIKGSSQNVATIGSYQWNYTIAQFKWVRVIYTKVNGTGNVDSVHMMAKR